MALTRRKFLKMSVATAAAAMGLGKKGLSLTILEPVRVDNPLESYPDRNWEKVYLDQYKYDSTFTYICSPNDTHACRVKAFVRNGVIVRVEQNYDVQKYKDLYGNQATVHWNPRMCLKGYTFHRKVYGPYRLKKPLIRKGWKEWADDGFPELTPENKKKYKFDSRGTDELLQIDWESAFEYAARGIIAIAKRYSGEEGAKKLLAQGYAPEMVKEMGGAGTRTIKCRGGMGLLGAIGKYGMYRFSNMLALLDSHIRGVGPDEAKGGRNWDNYTWHGDQAPGHPWVHGLQTSECDFNDLRNSKLHIAVGKNLVENKMPESHFFIELIERGAKVVVISPDYCAPNTKADYWIPVRPNSDTALFLGITKILMDNKWYDEKFVKKFTDFPLLVRTDTLKRLRADEVFPNYVNQDISNGVMMRVMGLTKEQRDKIGDRVIWDKNTNGLKAISPEDVGKKLEEKNIDPDLEWKGKVKLVDGSEVEVMTLWEMYKVHLRDYDIDTVAEITQAPKDLIMKLAKDIATIKPVAIHVGEGINHWFHATEVNRATYLPLMLTGNIGIHGAGSHTWAGNYKAALWQGSSWSGPGFLGWIKEDPFNPNLDPNAKAKDLKIRGTVKGEAIAYWNHGDTPLVVETPKYGRKVFTGKTAMPTPTKVIWTTNVNLLNNAKHAYDMLFNVNNNVELIMQNEIIMTSSVEYGDITFPANSWVESQAYEVHVSCSNPFLQIWKGGIKPLYDSKDDVRILAEVARAIGRELNDKRFEDYWKFALEGREEVYINRLLDGSATTHGYTVEDIIAGKYGEPGAALMLFRTYPRVAFYEQIHDSWPFYTDTGRLHAYSDIPEAIEYGENFVVHREGPEATPYQPNVIVSNNPYIRPDDYGLPDDAKHWDERTVLNKKMPWSKVKNTKNFLWEKGYKFYCITPKTRHRVHSSWSDVDWHMIWDSNFGDPYRMDKRTPGVGEHQIHINPIAARDLGLNDGDYVYVDANPADRPYRGAKSNDPRYRVARAMLRVKYNPAFPYHFTMMKHGAFIATEKSVDAHETRSDGRALSKGTGYQANFRYGSHQSITRDWSMPMHQTDSLFHKKKAVMGFMFGSESDNHAINTVPKETLVKISKAEDGGLGGIGIWEPATTGFSPANESEFMKKYLRGDLINVKR